MSYEYSDSYDLEELIDTLNNKISKIADLETKLAEKRQDCVALDKAWNTLNTQLSIKNDEINELKQQLADLQQEQIKEMQEHQEAMKLADKTIKDTETQNKRVLEKLELIVSANQELEQKLAESKNSLKRTIEHYEKYCSEINHQNVMLYASACNAQQASRDKIPFCIEQLEKVKEFNVQQVFSSKPLDNFIDNQIKQLEEME